MGRLNHKLSQKPDYFWLLAGLSLILYLVLFRWFPLAPYFNHAPSPDVRSLAPSLLEAGLYAGLIVALYGLYWLAFRWVGQRNRGLSPGAILATAAIFSLPLILAFPINATDVYRYFIRGRITSIHGENPFIIPAAEVPNEPYAPLAGEWDTATSPYGPVWEFSAAGITALVQDDLLLGLMVFKSLATLTFLAGGWLIWLALKEASGPKRASLTLLWAWNPSLLFIFSMNGHNDGFMMLWLLLGWWAMSRGRGQAGMIVMLLAPLTKPVGLLPLPFFFIAAWRSLAGVRARVRFLIVTVLAGLALLWVTFSPFGSPLALAGRLLSEAGSGGGFSPLALFILLARALGFDPSIDLALRTATVLFGLLALWLLWRTWRGRSPHRAAADIFAGYIVQAFRFRVWYASWPFPWLILDQARVDERQDVSQARLAAGITFLLTSQLSVVIYGQFRTELLLGSQLAAHAMGVVFTLLLPLLAGLVVARRGE